MLDTDAIEDRFYRSLKIHFFGQCTFALGSGGRDVGFQLISFAPQADGAVGQETGGTDGFAEYLSPTPVETHQLHVNSVGIFGSADNAEAVTGKCAGIVMDIDVHILVCGRGKSLGSRLAGITNEGDGRFALCLQDRGVEESGSFFLLQKTCTFGAVDARTLQPTVRLGLPGLGIGISGFMAVKSPIAVFDERLRFCREIMEVCFEDIGLRYERCLLRFDIETGALGSACIRPQVLG